MRVLADHENKAIYARASERLGDAPSVHSWPYERIFILFIYLFIKLEKIYIVDLNLNVIPIEVDKTTCT